ncbi:alpha,alpha-trehalase TreA [Luteimonas abyssi]|uniref:alpha,alpha-trehalase TreA n=1 Tax=Luteimonas abyssi TaxID=1247514 RepID=UPI000737C6F1|nr:alpha,alpha-trehalase TreA [Luteimonas abyssi]
MRTSTLPPRLAGACLAFALATGCTPHAGQTRVSQGATPAAHTSVAAATPLQPDIDYPELFESVQSRWLFPDQKLFVDAAPHEAPPRVRAAYLAAHDASGFDLAGFVDAHFDLPGTVDADDIAPQPTLRAHIDALWPHLTRTSAPAAHDTLLALPRPYVVPGGRFREIYYWDSYFTMRGLAESGRHDLVGDMLENFAHLIDTWGHIPNGNRSYYLSRSQPPFFSHMVRLAAQTTPDALVRHLPQLQREHAYWMDGADALPPGRAHRRVVRLRDGQVLNRYWDDRDTARPESFMQDRETAAESDRPDAEIYRDLRAGAESGWDYSSRWFDDPMQLHTIRTTAIVPVDLNSLLHHLERTIADACDAAGDVACAERYRRFAERRDAAIQAHLWHPDGYYADHDWQRGRVRDALTAAALFPLYVDIAPADRTRSTATAVRRDLLRPGGLVTTPVDSGQQWDAPNVWAPLQWVAVDGLRRHGEPALAREIAAGFIANVEGIYARDRKLVEKYDADGALQGGGGGEYPLQDGFGWSNGVALALLGLYPDLEHRAGARPDHRPAPVR